MIQNIRFTDCVEPFFYMCLTVEEIDESAFRVDFGLWKYNAIRSFVQPHESLARDL